MPVYNSLQNSPSAGGLYRKKIEQRNKMEAIPEGKGAIGTMTRNLVQDPIERPVAPGAKKVVGVRPSIQSDRGILPQNTPTAGQVAGPAMGAMGMMMPSRVTPKASSNKAGVSTPSAGAIKGAAVGTPAGISMKPKTVSTGSKAAASLPNTGNQTNATKSNTVSGSSIANPYITKEPKWEAPTVKNPSEQQKRAASTKFTPAVALQSIQKLISNPVKEAPKAAKGVVERVKETITNAVKGKNTYNKSILGILKSWFS